jgi:RNA-directed DNA polymerase
LEKFFDRVNHDVLMGRLAKRIEDKRLRAEADSPLSRTRAMMANGVATERHEGTPQGGPLSPLTRERALGRGRQGAGADADMRSCATPTTCNVYVRTEVAGERVMRSLVMLFGRLHLRVNEAKSAVAPAASRPFLSFTLSIRHDAKTEPLVAPKALQTMKDRVRQLTRRTRGRSLAEVVQSLAVYLNGWLGYFRVARTKKRFQEMDGWIRHRLRAYQLKQWKRGPTVFRELRARGLSATAAARVAGNAKRWWRNSAMAINAAIPNAFFDGLGLPRLAP